MQVDETSEPQDMTLKKQSTSGKRVPMFRNLDSNLCMATVLGYFISWDKLEKFLRCLNKQGQAFYDSRKAQFRHFIDDIPIPGMAIDFGDKSF